MRLSTITDRFGYFLVEEADPREFLGQLAVDPEFEPREGPMTQGDVLGQRIRQYKGERQSRDDWKKLRLKKILIRFRDQLERVIDFMGELIESALAKGIR